MLCCFQHLLSNSTCAATQRHDSAGPDHAAEAARGEAVQVAPIKPTLKAPGTKRLKLKCDEPLSNVAFNFNLRRYSVVSADRCRLTSLRLWSPDLTHAGGLTPEP